MKKKILVLCFPVVLFFSCEAKQEKYIPKEMSCIGMGDCGTGFTDSTFEILRYEKSGDIEIRGDTINAIKRIWNKLITTERLADSLAFELKKRQ